ncbi:glycoside hydrolase family 43 protein [Nocardia sp. BMG111209]|uniref:glycoside hydrolase family 43 protein n=1 Tax=Nocardia sp. BMG111209 TaxID=1160137 RepID=UPI000375C68B|nr:glycoside hydrolase family 43 protein [Nocardia sp. BMG111209]
MIDRNARQPEPPQARGLDEIQIRDPFLVVAPDHTYALFGSTDHDIWNGPGTGFDCWTSTDLVAWHGPVPAFRPPANFWSTGQYWAPEVHPHAGRWFMFATFGGPGVVRGTAVLAADDLAGPYLPWSDGPVTPPEWQCLDGTLHFENDGTEPWMIFCHEWVQTGDGEILAQRLTADLRAATDEPPVLLFRASEAPWVRSLRPAGDEPAYVTDGPFLHRTTDGTLLMLWSGFGETGYTLGVARSQSGHVLGPWIQQPEPLWSHDGGHAMIAELPTGEPVLLLHQPNRTPDERTVLRYLREIPGGIEIITRTGNGQSHIA